MAMTNPPKYPYHLIASPDRPWLTLQTVPKKEGLVMSQLPPSDYETYRPMMLINRDGRYHVGIPAARDKHGNPRVMTPEPMFPGYLFIRPNVTSPTRLGGLPGLAAVYHHGLPNRLIAKVRAAEEGEYIRIRTEMDSTLRPFTAGDRVRSVDGFVEFVVTEPDGANRIFGLSAFFNGAGRIVMDSHKVARVVKDSQGV